MFPNGSPSARADHAIATVWGDDRVVMFGGRNGTGQFDDTWVYDLGDNQWSLMSPGVHPPARYGHTLTTFAMVAKALLFGGRGDSPDAYCDTWTYDLRNDLWTRVNPTNCPGPSYYHSTAAVWNDDKVISFGGYGSCQTVADTWSYDAGDGQWSLKAVPGGPAARCGQSMGSICQDDKVVIYGGTLPAPPYPDIAETWVYDAGDNRWSFKNTSEHPVPRENMAMAGMNGSSKVVLFGGAYQRGNITLEDTWVYDPCSYRLNGTYISPPHDSGGDSEFISIGWSASTPPGTSAGFQLRAANTSDGLQKEIFTGPYLSPDTYFTEGSPMVGFPAGRRWVQCRVFLQTSDRSRTPAVNGFTIGLDSRPEAPVLLQPDQEGWVVEAKPTFTWDFKDPDSSCQGGFEWQICASMDFSMEVRSSGECDSNATSYRDIDPIEDGTWYWRVRTRDIEGEWGPFSACRGLRVDTAPPRPFSPNTTVTGWTSCSPTIKFSTTDGTSGMDRYELLIDRLDVGTRVSPCALPDMPDGIHEIIVRAFDLAGKHVDGIVWVFMDKSRPEPFTPVASPASWTAKNPQISFSTRDNVSDIDHYEIRIDKGDFQRQSSPFTLPDLEDGSHDITVRAFDMAGNFREEQVAVYIDKSAPDILAISVDPADWTNADPVLRFGAMDKRSQIDHYDVAVDYGKYFAASSPSILLGLSDGYHAVSVRAFDEAGNMVEASTRAFVDKTPPRPFVPTAEPGTWSNEYPTVNFSTTDEYSPPLRYELAVGDGPFEIKRSPSRVMGVPDGQHVVHVRAYDVAGNCREGNVTIFLDRSPPENVSLATGNGSRLTNRRTVRLSISASDNASGVDQMCFSYNGREYTAWEPFGTVRNWTLSPGAGAKKVYIKVKDRAGNEAPAVSSTIDYEDSRQNDAVLKAGVPASILLALALVVLMVAYRFRPKKGRTGRRDPESRGAGKPVHSRPLRRPLCRGD
jgi:hypothetical protein